jgi:RNA polymerase sigma factor (sigma-70 family)
VHTLLQQFLDADGLTEVDSRLSELIERQAGPLIRRVVSSRLRDLPDEVDDVSAEARMELLLWLRRMKSGAAPSSIEDFDAYTSTIAINACNRFFRRRPAREHGSVQLSSEHWNVLPDRERGAESRLDARRYAARLWAEISELPRKQRVALLLHLRDDNGNPVLPMFPVSGVAFLPQLAAALEIPEVQLAALWQQLPMDDNSIGALLDCTRQQVINLRMSARKRLANRMGKEN